MLWAQNFLDNLPFPDQICDVSLSVQLLQKHKSAEDFIAASKLRSAREVLDEVDFTFRCNWACVEARGALDPGVVKERHHALNWLVGYMGQEWDDVTTDT